MRNLHTLSVPACQDGHGCRAIPLLSTALELHAVQAKGTTNGLHSATFKLDEDVLSIGAAYHAALATEFLASKGRVQERDEL